jgi:hypothetical protein
VQHRLLIPFVGQHASPVLRLAPFYGDLKTDRSRHPACRDTRTSLYIGRYRHPASRDTHTSLCIEILSFRAPSAQAILQPRTIKPGVQSRDTVYLRSLTATGTKPVSLYATRRTCSYVEAPNLPGRVRRPCRKQPKYSVMPGRPGVPDPWWSIPTPCACKYPWQTWAWPC